MKKFLVAALLLLMIGSTSLAFAWWDRLEQGAEDQTLDMGYGVRLVLENETTKNQGVLVPVGSFYAAVDGYTTEYVFTYELNLEENLDDFDLLIDVKNLKIGGLAYDQAPNVHGPLSVVIESDKGSFVSESYDTSITGPATSLRLNEVLQGNGVVTITLTFSLQNHSEDAAFEGDLVEAYKALAGKEISFDIAFEVPTFANQSNQNEFNVHPEATQPE